MSNPNVSSTIIVWLDTNVNQADDNRKAQTQLSALVKNLKTFESARDCNKYLINDTEKNPTILIVSGSLGRDFVPKVIDLSHIQRIYVYCSNIEANRQWAEAFSKTSLVTNDLRQIISHIRLNPLQLKPESITVDQPKTIVHQPERRNAERFTYSISDRSIFAIDERFFNWQLFIDILLRLKPQENPLEDFYRYLTTMGNFTERDLSLVEEFRTTYRPEKAMWWYTNNSVIYRLLNEALRNLEGKALYMMRFFIRDLRNQLMKKKCNEMVKVYQAQTMSKVDVDILLRSKDKWIAINSYLLTCPNRDIVLDLTIDSNLSERVLFEIDAFPDWIQHQQFAQTDTDEILFMLGSIFEIKNIRKHLDGFYIVQLIHCSDADDEILKLFYKNLEKEIGQDEVDAYSFGDALRRMCQYDDAKYFLEGYHSKQSTDPLHEANYHLNLGRLRFDQRDHRGSIKAYRTAIDIFTNDNRKQEMADTYVSMALVHSDRKEYEKARESFEKALNIYRDLYGDENLSVAICYDGIGSVYENLNKLDDALHFKVWALTVLDKILEPNHPDLGQLYASLGRIASSLHQYDKAIEDFDQALRIYKNSLPANHIRIASVFANKGIALEAKGKIQEAIKSYENAIKIYQNLSLNHHDDFVDVDKRLKKLLG